MYEKNLDAKLSRICSFNKEIINVTFSVNHDLNAHEYQ